MRLASLAVIVGLATDASAFTFAFGDASGAFDTTLSGGLAYRLKQPDRSLIGRANGGTANSVNTDDGVLNYDRGFYSQILKGTHDLELRYGDAGAFFRASYFKDFAASQTNRTRLTGEARERVVSNFEVLDAYARYRLSAGAVPMDVRFGQQVLSWGESTFIPNGINVLNPVDISRLRVPGAELREALLPVTMLTLTAAVTDSISLEAFYQFDWKPVRIDPRGSYFGTNDFIAPGGERVYLGFGGIADTSPIGFVPRAPDRRPSDHGQFGVAARWLTDALGSAEFGVYLVQYHSRLPLVSAITPTTPIDTNLTGPLTAVFVQSGLAPAAAAQQAQGLWQLIVLSQTNPGALTPQQLAQLQAPQTQAAINGARQIAFLTSAATGRYFADYPEEIRLLGVSMNADVGRTGISFQGELSYKWRVPLQIDDVELLFAALSAINPTFGPPNNQIGNFLGQLGREIRGWRRFDVWQAQGTATKVFGRTLGASQLVVLGELGAVYVPDLPPQSVLRFDGPATYTSGSQAAMNNTGNPTLVATPASAFAREFSWGYQVVARFDYTNLFGTVNVSPSVAFAHDVGGNTPLPYGNFLRGRRTLTLGAEFTFQNRWSAELRYTHYAGAGQYNLLRDRDFVSSTLKVSF